MILPAFFCKIFLSIKKEIYICGTTNDTCIMKKTTLAILSLFAALSLAVSCGYPAENTKSLLWKISGNGLEQPSYLFGTWHGDTELRGGSFLDSVTHFYSGF